MSVLELAATVLLGVFVISGAVAGFLFGFGESSWTGFAALSLTSLTASWIVGAN